MWGGWSLLISYTGCRTYRDWLYGWLKSQPWVQGQTESLKGSMCEKLREPTIGPIIITLHHDIFWIITSDVMYSFSVTKVCTGDFAPPEPEFRAEFWETNFGCPNFGPEFLGRIFSLCFFPAKEPPEKFTLEKFTSQNSPSKIQPRNRAKKITLHLCRTIWLTLLHQNNNLWINFLAM